MAGRAFARRRVIELARLGFREFDQRFHVVDRQRRVHDEHARDETDATDRREIRPAAPCAGTRQ